MRSVTYRGDSRADNTLTARRFTRCPDPTNHGWSKPTIGKAEYFFDLNWLKFRMVADWAYSFKTCDWERVYVVYPILTETGEPIGEPIVYNIGCDLDALTDALIDYAGRIETLLSLIQLQHFEARLAEYRAWVAEEDEASSPPASAGCPDDALIPW